ncbi:MAG TPA: hypothetical protein ENI73_07005 [Spirochaetes bacterium]|nr:hypothetical protein [Spirochaetota bacterium]
MDQTIPPKLQAFKEKWDTEYIEIDYNDVQGDFYPNERGLVVLRRLLREDRDVDEIVVDGDFDLRDQFDDEFYAFAHLQWGKESWNLTVFNYDQKIDS